MIVVVLVGISAAMVAPGLMRAMNISRANRCQYDVARLLRRARGEAIGTGRAYLVNITTTASDVQLDAYIGDSSSCTRANWPGIVGVMAPIDQVWQSGYDATGSGVFITITGVGAAPQQICFEPDGDRFHRFDGVGVFLRTAAIITVNLNRHEQGVGGVDVLRQIVIPQFSAPRVVR